MNRYSIPSMVFQPTAAFAQTWESFVAFQPWDVPFAPSLKLCWTEKNYDPETSNRFGNIWKVNRFPYTTETFPKKTVAGTNKMEVFLLDAYSLSKKRRCSVPCPLPRLDWKGLDHLRIEHPKNPIFVGHPLSDTGAPQPTLTAMVPPYPWLVGWWVHDLNQESGWLLTAVPNSLSVPGLNERQREVHDSNAPGDWLSYEFNLPHSNSNISSRGSQPKPSFATVTEWRVYPSSIYIYTININTNI